MPRRAKPDPLAQRIGARVRELRRERGLTLEALAWAREDGEGASSKGHLSDLERGLVVPNVATLNALAAQLECSLADLVTFVEEGTRAQIADSLRSLTDAQAKRVLRLVRELSKRD
jgi:transcriptional regulator with XRE-family HTH domain